jgi:hypothetical protein
MAVVRLSILLVVGLAVAGLASAQTDNKAAPVSAKSTSAAPVVALKSALTESNKPLWKELSSKEQIALGPLIANWDGMAGGQKSKWLSVAKDFDKLPASQQAKMHTRMTEWTALSPQQRAAARMNFAQNRESTDGLTPEQRKVQWDAYQLLSPEEKRKLAESAPKTNPAAAVSAARPQPVLKKEPRPDFGTGKALARAQTAPTALAPGQKIAVPRHVASQGLILPGNPAAESANKP